MDLPQKKRAAELAHERMTVVYNEIFQQIDAKRKGKSNAELEKETETLKENLAQIKDFSKLTMDQLGTFILEGKGLIEKWSNLSA